MGGAAKLNEGRRRSRNTASCTQLSSPCIYYPLHQLASPCFTDQCAQLAPAHHAHSSQLAPATSSQPTAGSCTPRHTSPQYEGPKQVARRSDVDMNGHINNVTYLAWALETMPNDVYSTHRVYEVRVRVWCVRGVRVWCVLLWRVHQRGVQQPGVVAARRAAL